MSRQEAADLGNSVERWLPADELPPSAAAMLMGSLLPRD
jgi:hypothetical protein